MTAWDTLTDVQADAVHATAAKHLRDPEDLAAELAPLLAERPAVAGDVEPEVGDVEPSVSDAETERIPVVFEGNFVADPVWSLLGTTETGFSLSFAQARAPMPGVNESLTPTEQEMHTS